MAPQIPIQDPATVQESVNRHLNHPQLQKKELTQFNCHFEDQGRKVVCEPFTRFFWECTHTNKKTSKTRQYHWEYDRDAIDTQ